MDVLMPQLGETVTEGKVATWFKTVGDAVAAGENLFEIETDKVTMEVQATSSGVLAEIRVPAGATVPVGTIVAVLGGKGEAGAKVERRGGRGQGAAPRSCSSRSAKCARRTKVSGAPPGRWA